MNEIDYQPTSIAKERAMMWNLTSKLEMIYLNSEDLGDAALRTVVQMNNDIADLIRKYEEKLR